MCPLVDPALPTLLAEDPSRGWRIFVDQYTPTLPSLIERAGITDKDEAMEVYVRVCEHLAANECARLRRHDPSKGYLAAWLAVVVRHVVVDWVRSRAGRRRIFGAIRNLGRADRRVFELYYRIGNPARLLKFFAASSAGPSSSPMSLMPSSESNRPSPIDTEAICCPWPYAPRRRSLWTPTIGSST